MVFFESLHVPDSTLGIEKNSFSHGVYILVDKQKINKPTKEKKD